MSPRTSTHMCCMWKKWYFNFIFCGDVFTLFSSAVSWLNCGDSSAVRLTFTELNLIWDDNWFSRIRLQFSTAFIIQRFCETAGIVFFVLCSTPFLPESLQLEGSYCVVFYWKIFFLVWAHLSQRLCRRILSFLGRAVEVLTSLQTPLLRVFCPGLFKIRFLLLCILVWSN